jgi:hypothetical protein
MRSLSRITVREVAELVTIGRRRHVGGGGGGGGARAGPRALAGGLGSAGGGPWLAGHASMEARGCGRAGDCRQRRRSSEKWRAGYSTGWRLRWRCRLSAGRDGEAGTAEQAASSARGHGGRRSGARARREQERGGRCRGAQASTF